MERTDVEGFALSPQQRLAWRLRREGARAGSVSCLVRVEGPAELATAATFETLLARLARENEILRTRFAALPPADVPVQVIEPEARIRVEARPRPRGTRTALEAAERVRRELEGRAHDPAELDALRAAWIAEGDGAGWLVLCQSDLHADRKSLELLLEALVAALETPEASAGEPAAAPELADSNDPADPDDEEAEERDPGPLQYADVSQFLQDALLADEADEGFAFWRRAGTEPGPEIGLARRAGPTTAEPVETVLVDERVAEATRSFATKLGVEPAAVYCAAWQVVLARHAGRARFTLGVNATGRTYDGLDACLGPLSKLVPLPCHVDGSGSFTALVGATSEHLETADERQEHFDFERAFPGRPPIFPVAFEYLPAVEDLVAETPEGEELVLRPRAFRTTGGRAATRLVCDASSTPAVLRLVHSPEILSREAAERLLDQLRTVLERARAVDARTLEDVSAISRDEQRILDGFARSSSAAAASGLVPEWFAHRAAETPDAVAVVADDGRLTYGELASRARRLARRLVELGVGPGSYVGIHMGRSVDLVVALVAVLEAGGAYLPLPPDYPPERVAFMLADSRCAAVVTREREHAKLTTFDGAVLVLEREAEALAALPDGPLDDRLRPDAPAYLIYTSGSSGRPKGVPILHSALAHSTHARLETYAAPLVGYLLVSSFAFDSSVAGIFWTLASGGALFLPPDGFEKDLTSLPGLIRRHAPSHFLALPSLWSALLELDVADLASLTTVIVAGEVCPRELVVKHLERLPSAALHNEYGPTENTVWSTVHACTQPPVRTRVPIGRPIPRVEVRVLDAKRRPCPVGVAGELCLGGPGVAPGYLERPELSDERFVPGPTVPDRLYRTGDLVRFLETGELEFLGRLDQQVKLRGHRIELEEIEAVLLAHPRVRAVAVGVRGAAERARLVAWFVPAVGKLNPIELKAHLVSRLPEHMIPGEWVELSALPLLPNGKVDRTALPEPGASSRAPYVAPATPLERVVCAIWSDVLGTARVGLKDDFFALGGHSILATQLVARMADLLKTRLSVRALFDAPTPQGSVAAFLADPERTRLERTAELLVDVLELDRAPDGMEQAS